MEKLEPLAKKGMLEEMAFVLCFGVTAAKSGVCRYTQQPGYYLIGN